MFKGVTFVRLRDWEIVAGGCCQGDVMWDGNAHLGELICSQEERRL